MRVAFIGTNGLSTATARLLLERGHEVVIVERTEPADGSGARHVQGGFTSVAVRCETVAQATGLLHQYWERVVAVWPNGAQGRHRVLRRAPAASPDPWTPMLRDQLGPTRGYQ